MKVNKFLFRLLLHIVLVLVMYRYTGACGRYVFAGDQSKSSSKNDVDIESDTLPPVGLVVTRTAKSVCTRSAVTRSKTGRKK